MLGSWLLDKFLIAHFCCPEVAQRLSKSCPKGVQGLSKSCPKPVQKLPKACPKVDQKLSKCYQNVIQKLSNNVNECCWKVTPRHKHRNGHESGPHESCEFVNRCILHRISVRTTLWWRHFLGSGSNFGPWDISTEMVTKVVSVRAVNFSIGAFCTEFRCEQLCDDGVFRSGPGDRPSGPNLGLRNDISYRKSLEFASKNKKCEGLAKTKKCDY